MNTRPTLLFAALLLPLLVACGSDDSATAVESTNGNLPYAKDKTVVIGPDGVKEPVATPDGKDCLALAKDAADCTRPQDTCGEGGRADVVVDAKGKVVAVICYPVDGTPVATVPEGGTEQVGAENKEIVVIDGKDDGVDVTGDVTITGNNVVVYGSDPATSIIGGDLVVSKNDGTIRGVTINGDVRIDGNNTALVDCVVRGNVTITSNNNVLVSCTVFGNVTVTGNNNTLYYNRLSGLIEGEAKNMVCGDNRAFVDLDADGIVSASELGDPVACGK